MQPVELLLVLGTAVLCALGVLFVVYLRYHRSEAFKGDSDAARKLILPAFEPLLWIIATVNALLTAAFCGTLTDHAEFAQLPVVAAESVFAAQQFVVLVVLVLLLQKSVCLPSLRRAVVVTFLLSTYMIPIAWCVHELPDNHSSDGDSLHPTDSGFIGREVGVLLARVTVLALYVYVSIRPPDRASKRTLREYAAFAGVYHSLLIVTAEVLELRNTPDGAHYAWISDHLQYALMSASLCWSLLSPFVVWRVLKADTEHWRGLGHSAQQQQQQRRGRAPIILERISSEGLHVLIEMHRKHVIDFAYLELLKHIGVGSSSTVFHGLLYSKIEVAVKVYTPSALTDEVVESFSHEAALCGSLHHPNIVKFFGMCVSPPTICLVSERCQGSLDEVVNAMALHAERSHDGRGREQLLINLGFMIDAARSVAYLHSFSPAFLHRDIKPSNFLVDFLNNVKLTDFGESRCLPLEQIVSRTATSKPNRFASTASDAEDGSQPPRGTRTPPPTLGDTPMSLVPQLTVKGTVDYMAPEIIRGHAGFASYGEAADVYALGITFWDILYPRREKFPHLRNNHLHIFQAVLDGKRPQFESRKPTGGTSASGTPGGTHLELRHVIQMAWHQDAHQRPSAQQVVRLLERILELECARFARDFRRDALPKQTETMHEGHDPDQHQDHHVGIGVGFNPLTQTTSVTGAFAVSQMVELKFVRSTVEAVRLGNLLMDAGVLHHVKHTRPFEDADSEVYFFDQYSIRLYDPMPILEDRCSDPPSKTNAVHPESPTHAAVKKSKSQAILDALHLHTPVSGKIFTRQWAHHHNHTLFSRIAGLRSHHHWHWHHTQDHEAHESHEPDSGAPTEAHDHESSSSGFQQCRCRKLSQRVEEPKASLGHRFRERLKLHHHHNHHPHLGHHHDAFLTTHLLDHNDPLHLDHHDHEVDAAYEPHDSPHYADASGMKQKRALRFGFARAPHSVVEDETFSSDELQA